MKKILVVISILASFSAFAQRSEVLLEKNWKFHRGDVENAQDVGYDDSSWQNVTVPHDWAIYGPFSRDNDLQYKAVIENGETRATWKTGRTGGLPYEGVGWYRTTFDASRSGRTTLIFDGAMSEAHVYVNGEEVIFWPYGYSSFHVDVTDRLTADGKDNVLAVRLENRPSSSRWYPGAGLYRNVHVLSTGDTYVPVWGTQITTPHVKDDFASVSLKIKVENAGDRLLTYSTVIYGPDGTEVASGKRDVKYLTGRPIEQTFIVEDPHLWSPETPDLYLARTTLKDGETVLDVYDTRFGIRTVEFIPEKGFYLNGKPRKFQGVCNHHDLGPLGAAVNVAALRHQLTLLKDMGCNAIRTTHNMPDPNLVRLCDEMGFMMMVEPFDEWDVSKCDNGYHRWFNSESDIKGMTWAERDMLSMLHQWRNNPSVVLWSVGNEVPTQKSQDGYKVVHFLQDICHREDPTRLCTSGINHTSAARRNGFADALDIAGLNYHTDGYFKMKAATHGNYVIGSETASTVSSRGVYSLDTSLKFHLIDDNQCSSYDVEACAWSNIPDPDFALCEDYPWMVGQFVWTGFDYLGEPSPYDTDAWPNHSSMFGIIDLASIPKDRFWLYRSQWNKTDHTLHVLPHWNWKAGQNVPVYVYTDYPSAELFVNGVSQGRQTKAVAVEPTDGDRKNRETMKRFRLMWEDVRYVPGEIRVVAYDGDGYPKMEKIVKTAGKPHHIELSTYRASLDADGKDLAYVTVKVVDKDGNLCPLDGRLMTFSVDGAGVYRASANGDPTCLDIFHEPQMHAFGGMLTVIVQAGETPGNVTLNVNAKGLKPASLTLPVK